MDASLRGAAVALFTLLAISAARGARASGVARYSLVFDCCAIAYLVESAPALRGSHAGWIAPVRMLSNAAPGVFWLWAEAAFSDGFVPRWWRWWPVGTMLALSAWAVGTDGWIARRAVETVGLVLVVGGIARVLAGRGADLVDRRRAARLAFACGVGVWIAVTTLLGAFGVLAVPAVSGVLGLALAGCLLRMRLQAPEGLAGALPSAPPAGVVASPAAAGEDGALAERLRILMERDRLYREAGLTVAGLSVRLGAPEYRVRRLINQRLGHRNFVTFVNGYRLAEAMAALADPAQARVPVLTIALDAGFQSVGPFNRAFKAQTGETPSEYRRRHLAPGDGGVADC